MLRMLPDTLRPAPLPEVYPAQGPRRARVALLAGCVQQVLAPEIDWATLRVLARNGVETVRPAWAGLLRLALAAHRQRFRAGADVAAQPGRIPH